MRKISLFLVFCIFSTLSFSANIVGTWNFDYILPDSMKTGKNLKPISEGDAMHINDDGSFYYEISEAELIAKGSWTLEDMHLSLQYTLPEEITRTYQVTSKNTSLILNENGVNYAFKKALIAPTTIATSGTSLSSVFRGILGIISLDRKSVV